MPPKFQKIAADTRMQLPDAVVRAATISEVSEVVNFLHSKTGYEKEHYRDVEGKSLLHLACMSTSTELLKLLLDFERFSMNTVDYEGRHPLHVAAAAGHEAHCLLLLDRGCSPWIVDGYGRSAAEYATDNNFHELAEVLRERGGDPLTIATYELFHRAKQQRLLSQSTDSQLCWSDVEAVAQFHVAVPLVRRLPWQTVPEPSAEDLENIALPSFHDVLSDDEDASISSAPSTPPPQPVVTPSQKAKEIQRKAAQPQKHPSPGKKKTVAPPPPALDWKNSRRMSWDRTSLLLTSSMCLKLSDSSFRSEDEDEEDEKAEMRKRDYLKLNAAQQQKLKAKIAKAQSSMAWFQVTDGPPKVIAGMLMLNNEYQFDGLVFTKVFSQVSPLGAPVTATLYESISDVPCSVEVYDSNQPGGICLVRCFTNFDQVSQRKLQHTLSAKRSSSNVVMVTERPLFGAEEHFFQRCDEGTRQMLLSQALNSLHAAASCIIRTYRWKRAISRFQQVMRLCTDRMKLIKKFLRRIYAEKTSAVLCLNLRLLRFGTYVQQELGQLKMSTYPAIQKIIRLNKTRRDQVVRKAIEAHRRKLWEKLKEEAKARARKIEEAKLKKTLSGNISHQQLSNQVPSSSSSTRSGTGTTTSTVPIFSEAVAMISKPSTSRRASVVISEKGGEEAGKAEQDPADPTHQHHHHHHHHHSHPSRFKYLLSMPQLVDTWIRDCDIMPLTSIMSSAKGSFLPQSVVRTLNAEAARGQASGVSVTDLARWRITDILLECYEAWLKGTSYADKIHEQLNDQHAQILYETEQAAKMRDHQKQQQAMASAFMTRLKVQEEEARQKQAEKQREELNRGSMLNRTSSVAGSSMPSLAEEATTIADAKSVFSVALVCDHTSPIPRVIGNRSMLRKLLVSRYDVAPPRTPSMRFLPRPPSTLAPASPVNKDLFAGSRKDETASPRGPPRSDTTTSELFTSQSDVY